jgi:Mlc titration factor MtfA (ptsG expression regulator)
LSDRKKIYFEHRVKEFINHYQFVGKEELLVTDEMKVVIAGTYTMLTFGMRDYLIDLFKTIIIYPSVYFSTARQEYHKGEFNPHMKAVVFSWNDFSIGYDITNDNLNLGIHEFTHVVLHHSLRSNDASSVTFKMHYEQLVNEVKHPPNRQRLIDSDYFRIYAYTNAYEFIAVIVEHYFETPHLFQSEFPQLYRKVSLMLNHKS